MAEFPNLLTHLGSFSELKLLSMAGYTTLQKTHCISITKTNIYEKNSCFTLRILSNIGVQCVGKMQSSFMLKRVV